MSAPSAPWNIETKLADTHSEPGSRCGIFFPCNAKYPMVISVAPVENLIGNLSLSNYETDYWVAHTCYPSLNNANQTNYRLHHIVVPSPEHVHSQPTYAVFFEEQECRANFNDCVRWTFAPAYHFTWKGPILIMKVNGSDGQVADCTEMDLEDVREVIKTYVPDYFHRLIAQNIKR